MFEVPLAPIRIDSNYYRLDTGLANCTTSCHRPRLHPSPTKCPQDPPRATPRHPPSPSDPTLSCRWTAAFHRSLPARPHLSYPRNPTAQPATHAHRYLTSAHTATRTTTAATAAAILATVACVAVVAAVAAWSPDLLEYIRSVRNHFPLINPLYIQK